MYKVLFIKPVITKKTPFEPLFTLQLESLIDLQVGHLFKLGSMTVETDYIDNNEFFAIPYKIISVKHTKGKIPDIAGYDAIVELVKV